MFGLFFTFTFSYIAYNNFFDVMAVFIDILLKKGEK